MYLSCFHTPNQELCEVFLTRQAMEQAVRLRMSKLLELPQECYLADTLRQFVLGNTDFDTALQLYNEWFGALYGHIRIDLV